MMAWHWESSVSLELERREEKLNLSLKLIRALVCVAMRAVILTGFVGSRVDLVSNRCCTRHETWLGKRDGDGGERATALTPPQ